MTNQWILEALTDSLTVADLSSVACSAVASGSAAANAVTLGSSSRYGEPLVTSSATPNLDITLANADKLSAVVVIGNNVSSCQITNNFSGSPTFLTSLKRVTYPSMLVLAAEAGETIGDVDATEYRLVLSGTGSSLEVYFAGLFSDAVARRDQTHVHSTRRRFIDHDIRERGPSGTEFVAEQLPQYEMAHEMEAQWANASFYSFAEDIMALSGKLAFSCIDPGAATVGSNQIPGYAISGIVAAGKSMDTQRGSPLTDTFDVTIAEAIP